MNNKNYFLTMVLAASFLASTSVVAETDPEPSLICCSEYATLQRLSDKRSPVAPLIVTACRYILAAGLATGGALLTNVPGTEVLGVAVIVGGAGVCCVPFCCQGMQCYEDEFGINKQAEA